MWRKDGDAKSPKKTLPTVKFGSSIIMYWGYLSEKVVGEISAIDDKINAQKYRQILQENLMSSVESLELPSDNINPQNNDPKHTTKSTKKWLSENKVNVLQWPIHSLDLNPIWYLWRFLKIQILKKSTSKHH